MTICYSVVIHNLQYMECHHGKLLTQIWCHVEIITENEVEFRWCAALITRNMSMLCDSKHSILFFHYHNRLLLLLYT